MKTTKTQADLIRQCRIPTAVGFNGTVARREVGGPLCLGIIVGVAIYEARA